MSSKDEIAKQVKAQATLVRELKANPDADAARVQKANDDLAALKVQLQALQAPGKEKREAKFTLKTAKGTKDWHPSDMLLRQSIFRKITDVFELHGAVTIDTPVFELKEILAGKYGEDSKLIYDLQDQGGELCSLRYDLTVPFARFLAMYGSQYPSIKRYHIAKVYRRDQPVMSKGRMREFYQCDFDIAGSYDAMLPDAEILTIACEILDSLGIDNFTIKVNHRKILDGIFAVCGVPADRTRAISSAVDKLDKMDWEGVKKEMVNDKGLDPAVADRIGAYVKLKGAKDLVAQLEQDAILTANKAATEGLKDMNLLFKYLEIYGVASRISFDLSLARGLDYYTGIIYEAVTEGSAPPPPSSLPSSSKPKPKKPLGEDEVDESSVGVGSIAAGGRYDDLVGMFSPSSTKIPCVGISFGVERIFALLLAKAKAKGEGDARGKATEVYVMSVGDGLLEERMGVCSELWKAGIKAEFAYKVKPKLPAQFDAVDKDRIPFAVIIGKDELAAGSVRVKEQVGKDEAQGKGEAVPRAELVKWLKARLGRV